MEVGHCAFLYSVIYIYQKNRIFGLFQRARKHMRRHKLLELGKGSDSLMRVGDVPRRPAVRVSIYL